MQRAPKAKRDRQHAWGLAIIERSKAGTALVDKPRSGTLEKITSVTSRDG